MPIVEIIHWVVSDALASDHKVLKPTLDFLVKTKGCLGVYYGFLEEHKKFAYIFIVWETYEAHEALMKNPQYPQILHLDPCVGESGMYMNHVQFVKDFKPAFSAPTTQITVMTLKPGTLKELLISYVDTLAAQLEAKNPKYAPVTWGEAKEEENRFYLISGWESVQAHDKAVEDPSYHPFDIDLKSAVTLKPFYISLTKHA